MAKDKEPKVEESQYEGLEYTDNVERTIAEFGLIEKGTIISKTKYPELCKALESRIGLDFIVVDKIDPNKAVPADSAAGKGVALEDFRPEAGPKG